MDYLAFVSAAFVLIFVIGFWGLRLRDVVEADRWVPEVSAEGGAPFSGEPPLISVIVPAHNEEAGIRECLASVLGQDYPRFELIVVDDRSADETAKIASALLEGHAHCRTIAVKELPEGWTGKCNALRVGARHAEGEWLAFLDADSTLEPSALRNCYLTAREYGVKMVTLTPRFVLRTFWEKALQPVFAAMSCILFPLDRVNNPASPVASANGMFFLIARDAYEKIGGHHDVKGLAVEDIGIGKRIKAAGLGLLFANGRRVLRTRMYTNFTEILQGWTRILSASMNYRLSQVVKFLAMHVLVSLPMTGAAFWVYVSQARVIWPEWWFVLPAICLVEMCVVPCLFFRQLGLPSRYCVLLLLGNLLLIWVFLIIVKRIIRQEALQWRGTTYVNSRHRPTGLDPSSVEGVEGLSSSPGLG